MKSSRFFSMLALVAVLGAAACGDRTEEQPAVTEQPVNIDDQPQEVQVAPGVTEGAIIMDTSAVGTTVDTTTR